MKPLLLRSFWNASDGEIDGIRVRHRGNAAGKPPKFDHHDSPSPSPSFNLNYLHHRHLPSSLLTAGRQRTQELGERSPNRSWNQDKGLEKKGRSFKQSRWWEEEETEEGHESLS
ncbi:hypothetical protein K1719_042565 [Acacia pycnantha]|nr:hypothetical protein K1719_042565 [Acacia pycnantha]